MSDTDSSFPSITFPATFEGAAAIGADFNTCLKFKPADALKVLSDLKALPRGTYDVTVVARQAQLAGDSVDREWAEMTLLDGDASELVYERTCLGARCPVFATHSSGEFEGRYVCENASDVEAFMEVVHGETRCPRFAASDAADVVVDEMDAERGEPGVAEVAATAARPLTPREIIEHFEGPQEKCPACGGDGRLPDKTGGGHHKCKACDGRGEVRASTVDPAQPEPNVSVVDELPVGGEGEGEVAYSPDTMTVKELAEEFGALVIAAGDVDEMNEADTARYNVLSDELTARGRNPHDWQRIAEDDAA